MTIRRMFRHACKTDLLAVFDKDLAKSNRKASTNGKSFYVDPR